MRKGIQPALEQYLVTAGGGEGAAVVAAAAAASMDKRALLASPSFPAAATAAAAAAPSAYIQILTTNTSTTSCSSSLQSGAVAAGPLLPSAPGVEQTAGSLLYTTPHGPSSRAGLLQQPPALGRGGSGGGGGPPVMPSRSHRPQPGREVGSHRAGWWARCGPPWESAGPSVVGLGGCPSNKSLLLDLCVSPEPPKGLGGSARQAGQRGSPWREPHQTLRNFSRPPPSFPALFPTPTLPSPPTRSFLFLGRRKGSRPGWRRGWGRE